MIGRARAGNAMEQRLGRSCLAGLGFAIPWAPVSPVARPPRLRGR